MKFFSALVFASSAAAATIRINVGQSGLTFSPNTVNATKGDTLEFHFFATNHSVVQGDFSNPCKPATTGGFYSGFMPTSSGENSNVFQVTVNSTDPIVFYCSQNAFTHCVSGMSGIVNPTAEQSLATYQNNAKSAGTAVSPAAPFGGVVVAGTGGSSSSTSSSAPAASTTCSAPKSGGGGGYKRDTACPSGAPAGAAVSVAAIFVALGMALFMA